MSSEREVRKETDFWGNEKEVIYENDRKVGEARTEERGGFFGIGGDSVKVQYDNSGHEVSYTKQEERGGFLGIGADQVEVRYDSSDNELGQSRVEERGGFLGLGTHHVRVEYDNDQNEISQTNSERRGDFLGIGGERVRVTRYSSNRTSNALHEEDERTHAGSGYTASSSAPSDRNGLVPTSSSVGGFGWTIIVVAVVAVLFAVSNERSSPKFQTGSTASHKIDFIHNGITIPDPSNAGNYMLAGDRPCSPLTPECRIGPPGKFSIYYFSTNDFFNIWIGEPLAQSRKTAQDFLMKTLGITATEMCGLNYSLSTTVYDDYDYAGKELRFSSCPGAANLPNKPSNRHSEPRAG